VGHSLIGVGKEDTMFNVRALHAKSLTVVGKLLILTFVSSIATAGPLDSPRFFEYKNGGNLARGLSMTFGWFRTLDEDQEDAYQQSIIQAIAYGVEKTKGATACYDNTSSKWTWHAAK
jgi:hypothetical protein